MSNLDLKAPIETAPFDKLWVETLSVNGSPSGKVSAIATLKPYNGTETLDKRKTLQIPDVFALAATDPQFAKVMHELMQEIGRQAQLKKLFA